MFLWYNSPMLKEYLYSKSFFVRFLIIGFLVTHLMLILKNGGYVIEAQKLGFSFMDSHQTLFDFSNYNIFTFIIFVLTVVFTTYNIVLMSKFFEQQRAVMKLEHFRDSDNTLKKTNIFTSISFIIALAGTHCASCGAALFGGLLSLSGLAALPFKGVEISVLAIILLLYSNYLISKKVNSPYVC